jgi:hypothetical protein
VRNLNWRGAGEGFLEDFASDLISSDIHRCLKWAAVLDESHSFPFTDGALRGIVMTNVLKQLQSPQCFSKGATRYVRKTGLNSGEQSTLDMTR